MTAIGFSVPGHPLTWQRPPEAGRGRYDARGLAATAYQAVVGGRALQARQRARRRGIVWPLDGIYRVSVAGWWPDAREGDEDRLRSLVYDALQGVLYASDRQVKSSGRGGIGLPTRSGPRLAVLVELITEADRERDALDVERRARAAAEGRAA